jgi:hypothetical protein
MSIHKNANEDSSIVKVLLEPATTVLPKIGSVYRKEDRSAWVIVNSKPLVVCVPVSEEVDRGNNVKRDAGVKAHNFKLRMRLHYRCVECPNCNIQGEGIGRVDQNDLQKLESSWKDFVATRSLC